MDDLVAGVSAIMVSAVDPKSSTVALNRVGGQVPLLTTDSDAPDTNRIAYIGSSNTDAGNQAAEIALKALSDDGKCIAFVGLPGAGLFGFGAYSQRRLGAVALGNHAIVVPTRHD